MSSEKTHPKKVLHKYVGNLEAYYETGMEGCNLIMLHDDRGLHPGPKHDNSSETMMYKSLAWGISFDKRYYYAANIYDKEGKLVYEGPLTIDKRKIAAAHYRASFIPKEIDTKTWFKYLQEEYRAEVFTNYVADPIREQFKIEFQASELVRDELTAQDAIITTISIDKNNNVGYWVNNDYLEGGRMPWEISKIDLHQRWKDEIAKEKESKSGKK